MQISAHKVKMFAKFHRQKCIYKHSSQKVVVQSSSFFIGSKLIRLRLNNKLFLLLLLHTKHYILAIHLIFGHSQISMTLDQLVYHLTSYLVTLSISVVSESMVDFSTILLLLNNTHFLLTFVRFVTNVFRPHLSLFILLFPWKTWSLPVSLVCPPLRLVWPHGQLSPVLTWRLTHLSPLWFYLIFSVYEKKKPLVCSVFTGTRN